MGGGRTWFTRSGAAIPVSAWVPSSSGVWCVSARRVEPSLRQRQCLGRLAGPHTDPVSLLPRPPADKGAVGAAGAGDRAGELKQINLGKENGQLADMNNDEISLASVPKYHFPPRV